jgi:alpha-glucuronidase
MINVEEYDCWFQRHGTPDPWLAALLSYIVLEGQPGAIARNAQAELAWGLGKCFGIRAATLDKNPGGKATVLKLSPQGQKLEGFVITVTEDVLVITGADEAGLLYGVYRFLALLALGRIHTGLKIAEAPAAAIRKIDHWDDFCGTVTRGYAGRSLFFNGNRFDYDSVRIRDYARLLASIGINRLCINNPNAGGSAGRFITEQYLPEVGKLAAIFRPFGIRLMLSVNFAAPYSFGGLSTADPLDPSVAVWWQEHAAMVYRFVPDFAGYVVKADSEGEPGPFAYGRSHVDGANMLAASLAPHGGLVVWRCFVYNCQQDWRDNSVDRARSAYDHFMPLDGKFAENVILQIKHGPYDFQVREPVSPLFGALKKTRYLMELQITQEYTGQQIDLCFLPSMWAWVMNFDTGHGATGSAKIKELTGNLVEGFAAISSVGLDSNWTGHTLAQANFYGYGRLAWDPGISAEDIAAEWTALTFAQRKGADSNTVGDSNTVAAVQKMLLGSHATYEKYTAPFGNCFMVNPHYHYGPSPEGYEFDRWGTYHRADTKAIGVDRSPSGTGYTDQYPPKVAARFADIKTCPENLLLFLHRLPYSYPMKNAETLLQNIYNNHFEGYDEVEAMIAAWKSLEGKLGEAVYQSVMGRMKRQLKNAREWRDVINTYFYRKTGIGDAQGRKIYE